MKPSIYLHDVIGILVDGLKKSKIGRHKVAVQGIKCSCGTERRLPENGILNVEPCISGVRFARFDFSTFSSVPLFQHIGTPGFLSNDVLLRHGQCQNEYNPMLSIR